MYFSDSQNALLHSSVHSSNTFCVYSCCQFHSGEFPNKLIISLICFALVDNSRPPSYTVDDFLCNSQESSARYHLSQFPLFSLLYFPTPVAPGIFSLTLGEFFFSIWQITKVFPFRLQSREGWCWFWWQRHGMRLRGAEFKCPGIVTDGENSRGRYTRWEECWLDSILYTLRSALELDFHLGIEMCFCDGNERTKQIEWIEI